MKFAHLSDTHVVKDCTSGQMGEMFTKLTDPKQKTAAALADAREAGADFAIITGDLVHEGTAEDYRSFKQIVEENRGDMPVFVALGNHDRKEAFYQGYLGTDCEENYNAVHTFKGLRIIVADSAVQGKEVGNFVSQQVDFIEAALRERSELGSILLFHHPIVWPTSELAMPVEQRVLDAIAASDLRGIFCGHTHGNLLSQVAGIPQYVAGSTAFSMQSRGGQLSFVDTAEYMMYTLEEKGPLDVHCEHIWPPVEKKITLSPQMVQAMMEAMRAD